MGYLDTDYVQAMNKACQSGFSAVGDLRIYKRVVLGCFVVASVMLFLTLLNAKDTDGVVAQSAPEVSSQPLPKLLAPKNYQSVSVASAKELVKKLRSLHLWQTPLPAAIHPVVVQRFPADLAQLNVEDKKKAFLHSVVPIALIALSEVSQERRLLMQILDRYDKPPQNFVGADDGDEVPEWMQSLNAKERSFIVALTEKYRTDSVKGLLRRVNTVPVSLILAQGAIESSWGTSRFANLGNNLFGIWTWDGPGIVPSEREEGKTHKVAAYKTLLDSVRSYILMLNRVEAYRQLRTIRLRTSDPVALAAGLLNYSERGGVYVSDIGRVIEYNDLRDYDALSLNVGSVATRTAQAMPAEQEADSASSFLRFFKN